MKNVIRSVFALAFLALLSFTASAQTPTPVPSLGSTPIPTAVSSQPVPNTYISTGGVSNYSAPYSIAPYMAAGVLVTPAASTFPTYAGIRYEFYRDATGKPAYAGLASVKMIFYHKNTSSFLGRVSLFADVSAGGAGSITSISSALQGGGGIALQLGHFSLNNTPHWELIIEPEARRVPALANGTNAALLIGTSYTFNRPQ